MSNESPPMTEDEPTIEDRVEALEQENDDLRGLVTALQRRLTSLQETVVGDASLAELDGHDDIHTRVSEAENDIGHLRRDVVDLEDQWDAIGGGRSSDQSPDERAKQVRQKLYRKATSNNGKARLTRDEVNGLLGGELHRESTLDAMKRAAGGDDGEINGSSTLAPIEGISMVTGSGGRQSRVEIDTSSMAGVDVDRLTAGDSRNIMTTGHTGGED